MQNGEWRNYSFISIDEAVLHVIIQNDFLSWNLQHIIYFTCLMTIFYLTTQNVNLKLCVQPTHPPNIKLNVKSLKKYTHNLIPDIYIFKIWRFSTLSFCSAFFFKWTVKTDEPNQHATTKKSCCVSMKCWTFGVMCQGDRNLRITLWNMWNG